MVSIEDDTRLFWIFTKERCGHTVGVLTDDGYDRRRALVEMYHGRRGAKKALLDDGVEVRLVDARTYRGAEMSDQVRRGCTCPR